MSSITRQLQRKTPHTRKRCNQPLREPSLRAVEREVMRDTFSDARRGGRKGENVRKSICIDEEMTLEKVKRLTQGFKPGAPSRKNENGNLVTDSQGALLLWRKNFFTLLQSGDEITAFKDDVPNPIDVKIPPPSH